MAKSSKRQQSIIRNYYENRDAIAIQRLQELVSELYLAEGKKLERQWQLAANHLQKLGVPQSQIDHLLARKDPALVANLVKDQFDKS